MFIINQNTLVQLIIKTGECVWKRLWQKQKILILFVYFVI